MIRTGTFAPVPFDCSRRRGTYTHDVDACSVMAEVDCAGLFDAEYPIALPIPPLDGQPRTLVARGGRLAGTITYAVAAEPVPDPPGIIDWLLGA